MHGAAAAGVEVVALDGCRLFRPAGLGAPVEGVLAEPGRPRGFPERLSDSLGLCLKRGPEHRVRSDGRELSYPADALCLRDPGCVWSCETTAAGFLSVDLAPDPLPPGLRPQPMRFLPRSAMPAAATRIARLLSSPTAVEREEALLQLLDALMRLGLLRSDPLPDADHQMPALRRVRDCLAAHPETVFTLDQLARLAGANKFVLLRRFAEHYGTTPRQYQLLLRIERSRLLLGRGRSAAEVAQAVGSADQAHFGRQFKRVVGLPPGEYARRLRLPITVNFVQDLDAVEA